MTADVSIHPPTSPSPLVEPDAPTRIGVISDTHGLLRPEALTALRGVDLILHAGDLVTPEHLGALRNLAPALAVRGNMDAGAWARELPLTRVVTCGSRFIYMLHDLERLDLDPPAAGVQVVISGHTHRPRIETRDGVLYLNPGSAGPRRFDLPITLALLDLAPTEPVARIVDLN